MSCCDFPDYTVQKLIHDLSAPWVPQQDRIIMNIYQTGLGESEEWIITGVSVRRGVSLKLELA